jgi:cbb3-type cytochrome oxidase subunit 3
MKSLADVVGAAGLHGYAEVALVLFFIVFIAVVARVLLSRGREFERIASLPLDDEQRPHSSRSGDSQ